MVPEIHVVAPTGIQDGAAESALATIIASGEPLFHLICAGVVIWFAWNRYQSSEHDLSRRDDGIESDDYVEPRVDPLAQPVQTVPARFTTTRTRYWLGLSAYVVGSVIAFGGLVFFPGPINGTFEALEVSFSLPSDPYVRAITVTIGLCGLAALIPGFADAQKGVIRRLHEMTGIPDRARSDEKELSELHIRLPVLLKSTRQMGIVAPADATKVPEQAYLKGKLERRWLEVTVLLTSLQKLPGIARSQRTHFSRTMEAELRELNRSVRIRKRRLRAYKEDETALLAATFKRGSTAKEAENITTLLDQIPDEMGRARLMAVRRKLEHRVEALWHRLCLSASLAVLLSCGGEAAKQGCLWEFGFDTPEERPHHQLPVFPLVFTFLAALAVGALPSALYHFILGLSEALISPVDFGPPGSDWYVALKDLAPVTMDKAMMWAGFGVVMNLIAVWVAILFAHPLYIPPGLHGLPVSIQHSTWSRFLWAQIGAFLVVAGGFYAVWYLGAWKSFADDCHPVTGNMEICRHFVWAAGPAITSVAAISFIMQARHLKQVRWTALFTWSAVHATVTALICWFFVGGLILDVHAINIWTLPSAYWAFTIFAVLTAFTNNLVLGYAVWRGYLIQCGVVAPADENDGEDEPKPDAIDGEAPEAAQPGENDTGNGPEEAPEGRGPNPAAQPASAG